MDCNSRRCHGFNLYTNTHHTAVGLIGSIPCMSLWHQSYPCTQKCADISAGRESSGPASVCVLLASVAG